MARVLVVEDEPVLRSSVVRGLSKLPGVEVDGAGTLADALRSIDARAPELILSDLDLPDRSGIELIGELASRRLDVPVVFISAYLAAYGAQIPRHARVKVLEKPVEMKELRELVLEHVGESEGSGEPAAPFGLTDYVQLAAMGGHSVRIRVAGAGGGAGQVIVHRSRIWHAEDERGEGREALFRLLAAKPGAVSCGSVSGDPGPSTVEERWEELLLEAARLSDEQVRDEGEGAGADARPLGWGDEEEQDGAQASRDDGFGEAMERGLEAMLAKDHARALEAFCEARRIRPDDRVAEANVTRLREMGFELEGGEGA